LREYEMKTSAIDAAASYRDPGSRSLFT
jgi:hypothetical protein